MQTRSTRKRCVDSVDTERPESPLGCAPPKKTTSCLEKSAMLCVSSSTPVSNKDVRTGRRIPHEIQPTKGCGDPADLDISLEELFDSTMKSNLNSSKNEAQDYLDELLSCDSFDNSTTPVRKSLRKQVKHGRVASTEVTMDPDSLLDDFICQSDPTSQNSAAPCENGTSSGTQLVSSVFGRLQNKYKQELPLISQIVSQPTQEIKQRRLDAVVQAAGERLAETTNTGDNSLDKGFYGLPETVRDVLERVKGIKKLYDWQDACLRLESVKNRQNLVYSSPTSGGKTLVAEIMMLRELLARRKDCIMVLPFVSLVHEKIRGMSEMALELGFLVEEYAGSRGSYPPKQRQRKNSMYIATIEKASGLINSLIDCGRLSDVGLVVVDELHMLGESGGRGALLEMTLTKVMLSRCSIQIVGMSATLSNMADVCGFLDAHLYINDFRPVMLREYVKFGDELLQVDSRCLPIEDKLKHYRSLAYQYDASMKQRDPDFLAGLLLEIVPAYSCLIFCASKKNCESVSLLVCSLMPRAMKDVKKNQRDALIKEMEENCGKMCAVLAKTLPFGVAYHHSGLTLDERKLIEDAYLEGTLCALVCTSTLAAGVNLPAKRVIIRSPYVGLSFMDARQYRQMIGRAGRAGIDTSGESILIIQPKDMPQLEKLIAGPVNACNSSLAADDGRGLRKFILSIVGLKLCTTVDEVYSAMYRTLMAKQTAGAEQQVRLLTDSALAQLTELGLITLIASADSQPHLEVTQLGLAAYRGSIDAEVASLLYQDMCKAQTALSLQNYLHLIYLVTPYDLSAQVKPNWDLYFKLHGRLKPDELQVAELVGVSERYLHRKHRGGKVDPASDDLHTRFFVALMLYDLYREHPVWEVADRFGQNRGFVQTILQSAISFASSVYYFSLEIEDFWAYHALYDRFVKKFSLCAKPELNALLELPGVNLGKARLLLKGGYKTLQQLAYCSPHDLVKGVQYMTWKQARQIKATAMILIQEKAETLRAEADAVIALPGTEL